MKTFTPEELKKVLAQHKLWLDTNHEQGARANLTRADLTRADLTGANLYSANLYSANLSYANLIDANLYSANLTRANLSYANLIDANLYSANLTRAVLPYFAICPQESEFVAFKKLANGVIAKLKIPADANRTSSLVGRKCRAEYAIVLELSGVATCAASPYDSRTIYTIGEIVRPDSYDPDIRVECTHGIHFFITREEAEAY